MEEVMLDQGTIWLYLIVITSAVMVAFLSYKKGYTRNENGVTVYYQSRINKVGFITAFLILWLLPAFANCGTDMPTYNDLFLNAHNWDYCVRHHQIEVGWATMNVVIRKFTSQIEVYNAILAFLFLGFTFAALWKLKNEAHFGWAILAFSTTFYLQYMDLKRIYFASAIILYALTFLLRKQNRKYIFWVVIATLMHTSAVLMFVPLVVQCFISKKYKTWHIVAISLLLIGFIYVFRSQIFSIVISDRYTGYGVIEGAFGVMQLVYHVPLFWLIARYGNWKKNDFHKICLILACMSFVLSTMGYFVLMIGRAFVFFELAFIGATSINNTQVCRKQRDFMTIRKVDLINFTWICYYGFRFYMYLDGLSISDGLMPYISVFN